MTKYHADISGEEIVESTAGFSLISLLVAGLIYCIALLA